MKDANDQDVIDRDCVKNHMRLIGKAMKTRPQVIRRQPYFWKVGEKLKRALQSRDVFDDWRSPKVASVYRAIAARSASASFESL